MQTNSLKKMMTNKEILQLWQKDPFAFISDIWWLVPQKVLPEYEEFYFDVLKRVEEEKNCEIMDELKLYMFEPFIRWVHITWQQSLIIQAIKDAINWLKPSTIVIKTWHGIWKSNIMWKVIVWFLFCYWYSKIWLTAPDSQTLYDALFSEVWNSVNSMNNEDLKTAFKKTEDYLSVVWAEDQWFARCKTWKKENPEALAWLHAQYIALICDEASWIPNEIFESWQSNLTGDLNLFIMIWNPLRNVWFFYDAFWDVSCQNLHFNGCESPITWDYPQKIKEKYWEDSDEYRRRVLGKFPREDILDDKWYVQLIMSDNIKQEWELELFGNRKILGVDCAWEWKDLTTWVLRDNIGAIIVWSEKISDDKSIAEKTLTIMKQYSVDPGDVILDNFGAGANVAVELAALWYKTSPIYVWASKLNWMEIIEEGQKILNIRALLYWRLKAWIEWGAKLRSHNSWLVELTSIRYKRNLNDKIQLMPKLDMKKLWYKSPDFADALSLTFHHWIKVEKRKEKKHRAFTPDYRNWI